MVIREVLIGRIPRIFNDQQMYVVPAIAGSITAMLLYNAGHATAAIAAAPLVAFILGTAAYWAGWYVPVTMKNAPINTWARFMFTPIGKLEPEALRRWRLTKSSVPSDDPRADDDMMPTKGEVREALRGAAGPSYRPDARPGSDPSSHPATRDEFLGALYRVFVDSRGEDSADGWAVKRS